MYKTRNGQKTLMEQDAYVDEYKTVYSNNNPLTTVAWKINGKKQSLRIFFF
jgi:hypothetical protein